MTSGGRRIAVVVQGLGAPDSMAAATPFLRNLFLDPAILRVGLWLRAILARVISSLRVPAARANYALLGGRSPLLDATRGQAMALEAALSDLNVRCFIAMRYWHPFSESAARAVRAWLADEIVLLPLYPQFSTTTTGSSLDAWRRAAADTGLDVPTCTVCCYPTETNLVAAIASMVESFRRKAAQCLGGDVPLRVIFSAHGLPTSIVAAGDPYQWQVEHTVEAVVSRLDPHGLDWTISYQSRATPQQWLEPSTIAEIERAARDGAAVLAVPIAFVAEHSETLVELDLEYGRLARRLGVPAYFRVPAAGIDAGYIASLACMVRRALQADHDACSCDGCRLCPAEYAGCLMEVPASGRPGESST